MKAFSTWLLCGAALTIAAAAELPNVKLVDCQEVSLIGFDKCLRVKFSYLEEYAGLNKADGSSDVLVGKLYGTDGACNADSRVSLSINGDIYYVMIHDPSDEELYKLKVDISTGKAELEVLPNTVQLDHAMRPEETRALPQIPIERQSAMPAAGFRMKVQPIIDQSWRTQFGDQALTRLNAVIEHAKTFYQHSSLGTKFELDVQAVHNYSTSMKATGNDLNTLGNYVATGDGKDLPLANTYALMTMRDTTGAAGIAWKGTVCSSSRKWRTNINEYYGDLATAQILVHEIGHNLNMDHDFLNGDTNSPRVSSTGAACTNISSYMDYNNNPNKWSPCSVEDITTYYNSIGPNNYGTTCMTLLSDSATTTAAPTTAAPTTAAPTTAAPTTAAPTTAAPTTTAGPNNTTANPNGCAVPSWKADGFCDDENNTPGCEYDGGDCCSGLCDTVNTTYCTACKCLDPNFVLACEDCLSQRRCNRLKNRGRCNRNWVQQRCAATCDSC